MDGAQEFCILIPTRNRPGEVDELLNSIQKSSLKPFQIIVVASGKDISEVVAKFSKNLEITYIYSKVSGQINQKKLGISKINSFVKWVVFLDDDLLVFPDTFEQAFKCIFEASKTTTKTLAGIGLGLPATSRLSNSGPMTKRIARFFGLNNKRAGHVLSNGHATSYLEHEATLETKWLNGASMWRVQDTLTYGSHGISSNYAACEDLIFSYPIGKKNSLIYCPNAKLDFQVSEKTDFEKPSIYLAALYWRYFFVLEHQEFSILRFNITQLGRLIFAIKQKSEHRIKFFAKVAPATLRVAIDSLHKRQPRKFLESI